MLTVTQFIRQYLPESLSREILELLKLDINSIRYFDHEGTVDRNGENVAPNNVGTIIDHLTRFLLTKDPKQCLLFIDTGISSLLVDIEEKILQLDYWNQNTLHYRGYTDYIRQMNADLLTHRKITLELKKKELTDNLIIHMCQLIQYNNLYRAGIKFFTPGTTPNTITIENIRKMVLRSYNYLKNFPNIISTADFSPQAFQSCRKISNGDGDYRTDKDLIEMKALSSKYISSTDIYQCIVYYLLNQNQGVDLEKIYIINPRHGTYYVTDTKSIPQEIIEKIKNLW